MKFMNNRKLEIIAKTEEDQTIIYEDLNNLVNCSKRNNNILIVQNAKSCIL